MKTFSSLALCIGLTACGWHPLYQSGSGAHSVSPQLAQIRVDTIVDRQGQVMRNALIDALNPGGMPADPAYELIMTYSESQSDLGLSNDAVTTRGQLTIGATYRLNDLKTNKQMAIGNTQAITSYNIQNSEFATLLSHDDAENRALRQVADNVQTALSLYFENPHPQQEQPIPAPGAENTFSTPALPSPGPSPATNFMTPAGNSLASPPATTNQFLTSPDNGMPDEAASGGR